MPSEDLVKNLIIIPLLGLGLVFVSGCSRSKPAPTGAAVPVLAVKAFATNLPVLIDPPPVGHVLPVSSVTIRPHIGGNIKAVHFQEGQEVKKGDLLFTIDPRPAQAALARDQAQLKNAEIQFDREQKLFEQKLVSQDEFDTSKAARDTLTATVQTDELNLEYCEIRAPVDGRTGSLQFHAGNVVKSPDDVLLTINQIHPIYVAFAVPEQYLPQIKREMTKGVLPVSAMFQNIIGPPPHGELTFVDNSVDQTTGTILLKATFPNDDEALWPGQFVNVMLTLSELTNAIVVPSQAVQTGQNGQFIYVVLANPTNGAAPKVEARPVTTGITYQNQTVMETGVRGGETVVTDGQLRLVPGATVSIKSK